MTLVTTEDRGAVRLVTYANPPFGTMTAAGATEMLEAMSAAVGRRPAVRAIVITGGLPGIFIRHYDVGELSAHVRRAADGAARHRRPGRPRAGPRLPGAGRPDRRRAQAGDRGDQRPVHGRRLRAQRSPATCASPATDVDGDRPAGDPGRHLPRRRRHPAAAARGRRGQGAGDHPARPDLRRPTRRCAIGMVHEVAADPLARALEIAAELATRGAEGIAYAKRLTRAALDRPLAEGLADERRSFAAVMRTASAREGLRARPPAGARSRRLDLRLRPAGLVLLPFPFEGRGRWRRALRALRRDGLDLERLQRSSPRRPSADPAPRRSRGALRRPRARASQARRDRRRCGSAG